MRNPEVADGGPPQVGKYVHQVTETGLASTQHTDEAVRNGSSKPSHEKIPVTSPICCSSSAVGWIPAAGTPEAVCGRQTMNANTNAANLLLQACRGATIGVLH